MKIAIIGCGNAGSKIVDKCLEYQLATERDFISHAIAVNSASVDFQALEFIAESARVLIGEAEVKGHGAGTDNTVGKKVAEDDIHQIQRAIGDVPVHEIDAFIVAAGFGGGTGSGAAPVIAEHIQTSYDEPVYGLGVLPSRNEGGVYQLNTARSFPSLVRNTDSVIVFDNEVWQTASDSVSDSYDKANLEIAKRFVTLFGAGEDDGSTGAENAVDSSEIIKTLDCGGVASIGFSTAQANGGKASGGLLSRFSENGTGEKGDERNETKVVGLIRQATTGQLTLPCNVESTTKALALVSGPEEEMSRSGIESGRRWLEDHCDSLEVRGGDDPRPRKDVVGLVLLAGITECSRIDEFQEQATQAQRSMTELEADVEERTESLITDEGGEIDPL